MAVYKISYNLTPTFTFCAQNKS